jgi:hypothetical protein
VEVFKKDFGENRMGASILQGMCTRKANGLTRPVERTAAMPLRSTGGGNWGVYFAAVRVVVVPRVGWLRL